MIRLETALTQVHIASCTLSLGLTLLGQVGAILFGYSILVGTVPTRLLTVGHDQDMIISNTK